MTLRELRLSLESVRDETQSTWGEIEKKLNKSLARSEWKKYLLFLEMNHGSKKFAVDLGEITK